MELANLESTILKLQMHTNSSGPSNFNFDVKIEMWEDHCDNFCLDTSYLERELDHPNNFQTLFGKKRDW